MHWLPNPPDGTAICLGFDGSENNDWTALRAETIDGLSFTPRYGPDRLPTIWDPLLHGGQIPRGEVHAAVDELFTRYRVERMWCDPQDWRSEIGDWSVLYGAKHVAEWATNRTSQMFEALRQFETDLSTGRISHDGCPITATHISNSHKIAKPGQKYVLGKPAGADHQKIDASMATVLAHVAAMDSHGLGWSAEPEDTRVFIFRR